MHLQPIRLHLWQTIGDPRRNMHLIALPHGFEGNGQTMGQEKPVYID
jgi:hypothetical protein